MMAASTSQDNMPGSKMVYIDKANSADRPGTTVEQLAEELVAEGAKMIFFTSDDMKDGAIAFADRPSGDPGGA